MILLASLRAKIHFCAVIHATIKKQKALFNLISNKGALNYDSHDEKQVYHSFKNSIEVKFRKILKYVSTSLTLVALQEALILKLQKYQKSLKFQRLLYVKSLGKLEF